MFGKKRIPRYIERARDLGYHWRTIHEALKIDLLWGKKLLELAEEIAGDDFSANMGENEDRAYHDPHFLLPFLLAYTRTQATFRQEEPLPKQSVSTDELMASMQELLYPEDERGRYD